MNNKHTKENGKACVWERPPADFGITLLGKEVTIASSARDLALLEDSTLGFDEHIANTASSCSGSLCQTNRVRHLQGTGTLGNIVNALVRYKCAGLAHLRNYEKFLKAAENARITTNTHKFDIPTKATLFFFGFSEVNRTWLIISELGNQRARKVLFTCVVYIVLTPVLQELRWFHVSYY